MYEHNCTEDTDHVDAEYDDETGEWVGGYWKCTHCGEQVWATAEEIDAGIPETD